LGVQAKRKNGRGVDSLRLARKGRVLPGKKKARPAKNRQRGV